MEKKDQEDKQRVMKMDGDQGYLSSF